MHVNGRFQMVQLIVTNQTWLTSSQALPRSQPLRIQLYIDISADDIMQLRHTLWCILVVLLTVTFYGTF